jgi:hypothetical protein
VLPELTPVHEVNCPETLEQAAGVLTAAFTDDPVITWMVPRDLAERQTYIHGFMRAWTRFIVDHEGRAVMTARRDAALVWEPWTRTVALTGDDERAFRAEVVATTGPAAERCLHLIDVLDAHYPPDLPPHVHGAMAAVMPGAQTRGAMLRLAIEMLRYVHTRKLGIYCEASSDSSAALWQRLGATPVGEPIPLPDSEAVLTPLFIRPEEIAAHPGIPLVLAALDEAGA